MLLLVPAIAAADLSATREVSARLYERRSDGVMVGRRLEDAIRPLEFAVALRPVDASDIINKAKLDATRGIGNVRTATAFRLVPEDLTRRISIMHIAVVNYTDAAFAEYLARVGQLEGFSVVARLAPSNGWAEHLSHVPSLRTITVPGVEYVWTEDIAEIALDHRIRMTARFGDRTLLRRSLLVDRIRRYGGNVTTAELEAIRELPEIPGHPPGELPHELMRRFSDTLFTIQGVVERDHGQEVAAAIAAARGIDLEEAMTYLEGGNVLLGTLPNGKPYALVGRDSVAVSHALLERHAGHMVNEADVILAIARDLGVGATQVFLVEQPGVFHLDMAMTLLAPGTVVMNDAMEAFRLQAQWLREDHERWRPPRTVAQSEAVYIYDLALWREAGEALERTIANLWKYTERFARAESRAIADLEGTGLRVLRVPGRFLHPTRPWDRDAMNFLNGEAGTNARGGTFFVTLGGDARAERLIADLLLGPDTGLDRVYFAPRLPSRDSLWEKGGVGCRVKIEGELIR
jgi:hypothetical protein